MSPHLNVTSVRPGIRPAVAAVALAAITACAFLSGCATAPAVRVKPWQREYLAVSNMDPNRDSLGTAMMEHVYFSREAAQGGRGVGGAGCGCN